jgi:hypothetical protein
MKFKLSNCRGLFDVARNMPQHKRARAGLQPCYHHFAVQSQPKQTCLNARRKFTVLFV